MYSNGVYSTAVDNSHHVLSHVHQLIADSLAFAWGAVERSVAAEDRAQGPAERTKPAVSILGEALSVGLPAPKFVAASSALDTAATACKDGWLTALTGSAAARVAAAAASSGSSASTATTATPGADMAKDLLVDIPSSSSPSSSHRQPQPLLPVGVDSVSAAATGAMRPLGWRFVSATKHKEGWQYQAKEVEAGDAEASGVARQPPSFPEQKNRSGWIGWYHEIGELAQAWAHRVDTLESITFPVRFQPPQQQQQQQQHGSRRSGGGSRGRDGAADGGHHEDAYRPRLAVSYLRSYEGFGRVLYWIGGEEQRQAALRMYREHLASSLACEHARRACKDVEGSDRHYSCLSKWNVVGAISCVGRLRGNAGPEVNGPMDSEAVVSYDERRAAPPHVLEVSLPLACRTR